MDYDKWVTVTRNGGIIIRTELKPYKKVDYKDMVSPHDIFKEIRNSDWYKNKLLNKDDLPNLQWHEC